MSSGTASWESSFLGRHAANGRICTGLLRAGVSRSFHVLEPWSSSRLGRDQRRMKRRTMGAPACGRNCDEGVWLTGLRNVSPRLPPTHWSISRQDTAGDPRRSSQDEHMKALISRGTRCGFIAASSNGVEHARNLARIDVTAERERRSECASPLCYRTERRDEKKKVLGEIPISSLLAPFPECNVQALHHCSREETQRRIRQPFSTLFSV